MSVDDPISRLQREADARSFELGPFWAAVQMLSDQEIVDPAPELAKRILWRLGSGQLFDEALRVSGDEVLEESTRNSL